MSIFFEILVRIASYGPQIDQSHGKNRLSHIIKQVFDGHNEAILKKSNTPEQDQNTRMCNCRKKNECPLKGECLQKEIVYQATVTDGKLFIYFWEGGGGGERTVTPPWAISNVRRLSD